jgi:RNA polymerase sigma-70 factor (ECF subfamily)
MAVRDRDTDELQRVAAEFEAVRPRLFGIAYRMLGSAAEAEDVVQDAWVRWQTTDRSGIRSPVAFLSTMTTRLAINVASSARSRRETYIGPWLPEPVLTDNDPALGAENSEALEIGMLLLMERLTPAERAVYLLHEAFGYQFAEIAEVIETSEANARQLARRARVHLKEHRDHEVTVAQKNRLLRSFLDAAQSGDLKRLQTLLTDDIVFYSDGGGVVSAARRPIEGRDHVERFLLGVLRKFPPGGSVEFASVNGSDALVIRLDGDPYIVGTIGVSDLGIDRIFFVMNPAKLTAVRSSGNRDG